MFFHIDIGQRKEVSFWMKVAVLNKYKKAAVPFFFLQMMKAQKFFRLKHP